MKVLDKVTINKPVKILFVCLGNICRSSAADGIMQHLVAEKGEMKDFEIDSAGFYGGHAGDLPDPRMRAHAIRRGYNLTHRSRTVKDEDFDYFDIIIAMDDSNYSNLRDRANTLEQTEKIVKMASFLRLHPYADCIPDPYYGGAEGFENVLDLLEDGCLGLYDEIKNKINQKP